MNGQPSMTLPSISEDDENLPEDTENTPLSPHNPRSPHHGLSPRHKFAIRLIHNVADMGNMTG